MKREITSSKRVDIDPGSFGIIRSKEFLKLPENMAAKVGIRKSFGRLGLIIASDLVEVGYRGFLEIQVLNRGANKVEILEGTALLNIVVFAVDTESNIFEDVADDDHA